MFSSDHSQSWTRERGLKGGAFTYHLYILSWTIGSNFIWFLKIKYYCFPRSFFLILFILFIPFLPSFLPPFFFLPFLLFFALTSSRSYTPEAMRQNTKLGKKRSLILPILLIDINICLPHLNIFSSPKIGKDIETISITPLISYTFIKM